jgi:acyl carrier protein
MSVQSHVYGIVSHLTGMSVEEITPELRLLDYLDAPDRIEFIMEPEEGFDVTIPKGNEQEPETVGQAIRLIERQLEGGQIRSRRSGGLRRRPSEQRNSTSSRWRVAPRGRR